MSDMTALLDDLSYIPPNNEHNEPTQGDIGETSNEPTQATRNEFEELYSSANEALYPGCDHVTRLDFMAKFTYFKVKGKLTDSIFNEMLEWLQYALPESKGYKFPPSYYAIKKTFKTIGLGYESIHACEHDCCLFRGEVNKDLQFCPVCNTSRWKDSDTPGKKVPRKVLRYFPIIPRLQRLYKSRHTAKDMIWHATGKCTEPGKMQHPVVGRAWKNFDPKYLDFVKEPRNVRLGLATDGFNPFGNLSQAYNMWPVILTTYNLPSWLCMKASYFMLTLLTLGPKSLGKDINVYLRPLIEDLKSTYNLEPHMRSERWPRIEGYIQAQFGKSYNTNKATLKREHWIRDPETGAYDLDRIRRGKPDEYTDDEWEKYINFWNDPANAQRAETNRLNRSKSTVVSRHGSRSIPLTRHLMKMTSATQEEPSEIDTFYRLHTVNGVFQDPEALRMYDRMRELEATGEHTTAEINAMVRGGKLRGHIPGVGPVMPGYVRSRLSYTAPVDRSRDVDFMMSLMRSDNRFADAFARYDSGGASGSGGSRARDREDGDDTGGEDGGDDTIVIFSGKKSGNAAVQAVYKKKLQTFPQRHVAGERLFPSDMSLGKILGKILPPWHQFLDQKIRGAHFSLGIVVGERFAIELTPSTFHQRHFAGDRFPQRHVAGEKVGMLLGKHRML
ncbi:hypothetical protein Tco_0467514 [Tanacetum coccineum]